jgi:hypothetical protein
MSGLNQMSGVSLSSTTADTTIGNSRFAGKAASLIAGFLMRLPMLMARRFV